jgi:hypothetical protein
MAGWGMGPEPFYDIPSKDCDLLLVFDYRKIETSTLLKSLSDNTYQRIELLAWSMGVWVAGSLGDKIPFDSATALGGTCKPIDDKYGIPRVFFDTMIDSFSAQAIKDFYTTMFDSNSETKRFMANSPDRPLAELKEELVNLRTYCAQKQSSADIFSRHIVTSRDRIFPARNQLRAWGRKNSTTVSRSHFPFYDLPDWSALLDPAYK